ncbi:hypothetical protein K449DRAFT_233495 [Hypoxylon sp. EC38]|nr:hypothetical protein K449DRAFT_233495 [Hypoxylon sp. EC38]
MDAWKVRMFCLWRLDAQVDECQVVGHSFFDAITAGSMPAYSCKSPNVDNKRPYMSKLVIS